MLEITGFTNGITQKDLDCYAENGRMQKPGSTLTAMHIEPDGDYLNVTYTYDTAGIPFQRIRRITGYLVGTLDRFNDAKKAETADRVKHMA
jgi:hypothetical protein